MNKKEISNLFREIADKIENGKVKLNGISVDNEHFQMADNRGHLHFVGNGNQEMTFNFYIPEKDGRAKLLEKIDKINAENMGRCQDD